MQTPGFWGGIETLKAISLLYGTNIFIFNENGEIYTPLCINIEYTRCIFLAFKGAAVGSISNTHRNHYDSVCQIKQNDIFACVKHLTTAYLNKKKGIECADVVIID